MSIDRQDIKGIVLKLLDKAGNDPRLTPRILRVKAEQRLKLEQDSLKEERGYIKKIIIKWWYANAEESIKTGTSIDLCRAQLNKLVKAIGKPPSFFKDAANLSGQEKVDKIREILRSEGYKFSDVPTDEEIEVLRGKYEIKKDLEGLNQEAVLASGQKRRRQVATEPQDTSEVQVRTKQKIEYSSSDEEADL